VALFLGENGLSGRIPTAVFNQSSIETLSLEWNMLGGTLPPNIGDIFPNLEELILMRNEFEGPIPISLGSASMLEKIDLSNNNFTGTIPISLGKLSRLRYLSLGQNKLEANDKQSWEFLHALNNCSLLQYLTLTNNRLRRAIPPSVGNLTTSLTTLQFSWNYISGSVPASIGNLSGLTQLGLSYNIFTSTI
jgi:Leucine-rich repeat (LRR) protein